MNVQRDEIMEFAVLLHKTIDDYDKIEAQSVFYDQLIIENGPNNAATNNPILFAPRVVELWKSVKQADGGWSDPPIGFASLRVNTETNRVVYFKYNAIRYPENQKGSLEIRLSSGNTSDILTHVITVFKTETAEKKCVVRIKFALAGSISEEITTENFLVPRVNTWRSDEQHVYYVRAGWDVYKEIPIDITTVGMTPDISYYGVDVFCKKTQFPVIKSEPPVEIVQRTPDPVTALTQNFFTLYFSSSATVDIKIESLGEVPSQVIGLVGTPGNAQVSLTWQPPLDNGEKPVLGYEVWRSLDGTAWQQIGITENTSFLSTQLQNGQPYYFRVAAYNEIGEGGFVTTGPHVPLGLPSEVRQLNAVASDQQISVSWVAPSQDGGSSILNYVIERSLDGTTWASQGATTTTYLTATSLTNGVNYYFRVAAVNSIGTGPFSQTGPHMPFVIDVILDPASVSGFNESPEWFEVHNRSVVPVDLTGWKVTSHEAGPGPENPCVLGTSPETFNGFSGFTLAANQKVKVYTGRDATTALQNPGGNPPTLFWQSRNIWLNSGDIASLYGPGQVVGVSIPASQVKSGNCVNDPVPND